MRSCSASLASGCDDGDHLHLAELVLAQHAARIAPRRPGLTAEAVGQRRHPRIGSFALGRDLVRRPYWSAAPRPSGSASARRSCGRNPRRISATARCRIRRRRSRASGTAISSKPCSRRVQVDHELAERPFQPRRARPRSTVNRAPESFAGGRRNPSVPSASPSSKCWRAGKSSAGGVPTRSSARHWRSRPAPRAHRGQGCSAARSKIRLDLRRRLHRPGAFLQAPPSRPRSAVAIRLQHRLCRRTGISWRGRSAR